MSTILRALEKKKSGAQIITQQGSQKTGNIWRTLLLIGVAVIIALLSILIYIRLSPAELPPASVLVEPKKEIIKPKLKSVTKIVFQTKEMPENAPQQQVIYIAKRTKNGVSMAPKKAPEQKVAAQKTLKAVVVEKEQEVDTISPEMKHRFALAVSMTDSENENLSDQVDNDGLKSADGSDIHDMSSEFQEHVPAIEYQSHVYSSVKTDSWIKLNGKKLKKGDFDRSGKIEVVDIEPQKTIFRLGAQSFSLEALTDWKGR